MSGFFNLETGNSPVISLVLAGETRNTGHREIIVVQNDKGSVLAAFLSQSITVPCFSITKAFRNKNRSWDEKWTTMTSPVSSSVFLCPWGGTSRCLQADGRDFLWTPVLLETTKELLFIFSRFLQHLHVTLRCRLFVRSKIFLQWAVGEAKRNTMLPSILVCFLVGWFVCFACFFFVFFWKDRQLGFLPRPAQQPQSFYLKKWNADWILFRPSWEQQQLFPTVLTPHFLLKVTQEELCDRHRGLVPFTKTCLLRSKTHIVFSWQVVGPKKKKKKKKKGVWKRATIAHLISAVSLVCWKPDICKIKKFKNKKNGHSTHWTFSLNHQTWQEKQLQTEVSLPCFWNRKEVVSSKRFADHQHHFRGM